MKRASKGTKKTVVKKATVKKAPVVKKAPTTQVKIKALAVSERGIIALSDGGKTSCSRGASGPSAKIGDVFKKNKDGTYTAA